jgi:DNA-binding transcriptional ArsR family regulator
MAAVDHFGLYCPKLVEFGVKGAPLDVVHPRRVDRRPLDLARCQGGGVEIRRVFGQGRKEGAEAVGGEEGSVEVVDKSRGDRIVEYRWPEGGQATVAHRNVLPWVEEMDPVPANDRGATGASGRPAGRLPGGYGQGTRGRSRSSCDLEGWLGKSQPTVSHYTKVLAEAGLLIGEKRGRWMWWRVEPDQLADVRKALGG